MSGWRCPKCGHLNSGTVGGVQIGASSFKNTIESALRIATTCAACGARSDDLVEPARAAPTAAELQEAASFRTKEQRTYFINWAVIIVMFVASYLIFRPKYLSEFPWYGVLTGWALASLPIYILILTKAYKAELVETLGAPTAIAFAVSGYFFFNSWWGLLIGCVAAMVIGTLVAALFGPRRRRLLSGDRVQGQKNDASSIEKL